MYGTPIKGDGGSLTGQSDMYKGGQNTPIRWNGGPNKGDPTLIRGDKGGILTDTNLFNLL